MKGSIMTDANEMQESFPVSVPLSVCLHNLIAASEESSGKQAGAMVTFITACDVASHEECMKAIDEAVKDKAATKTRKEFLSKVRAIVTARKLAGCQTIGTERAMIGDARKALKAAKLMPNGEVRPSDEVRERRAMGRAIGKMISDGKAVAEAQALYAEEKRKATAEQASMLDDAQSIIDGLIKDGRDWAYIRMIAKKILEITKDTDKTKKLEAAQPKAEKPKVDKPRRAARQAAAQPA